MVDRLAELVPATIHAPRLCGANSLTEFRHSRVVSTYLCDNFNVLKQTRPQYNTGRYADEFDVVQNPATKGNVA